MDVEEGERKRGKKSIEREVEINVNDKKKKDRRRRKEGEDDEILQKEEGDRGLGAAIRRAFD